MNETPSKLFVYGSLKPGELGFEQIELLVKNATDAELHNYGLYVRDGLPVIKPELTGEIVKGNVLEIIEGKEDEFWKIVNEYEGTHNYKFESQIPVIAGGDELKAGVYIGRKMGKGNPEKLYSPWSTKLDPIFSQSFPLLHREISINSIKFTDADYDPVGYWTQLNGLLSQYLLLVSIFEHLTVVKYGGSKKQEPMIRIRKLQQSKGFSSAFEKLQDEKFNPPVRVSDSRAVEDTLSSSNPDQALLAWYQVRSNLQHRGKASIFDAKLVLKSCIGLSNFMFEYLKTNIEGIELEWQKIILEKLSKNEFLSDF